MSITLYELVGSDVSKPFSPHCWKIRMALAHKGLPYESIHVPFTSVATIEGGTSRRVPVIRDGDEVVEESFEIAKYLDRKYPENPLIGSPETEALTQFFINWCQTQVHAVIARLALVQIHNVLDEADKVHYRTTREKLFGMTLEEFAERNTATPEDLVKVLLPLELTLKTQAYVNGETPGFADYVVFGALQWLRIIRGDGMLKEDSNTARWFETLLDMYDGMGRKCQPIKA